MNVDTLISNGHVIDPAQNINEIRNIAIKNGKCIELPADNEPIYADETIDASG